MTIHQTASILTRYKDALLFAQELQPRHIYKVKDVAKNVHERTVRRRIKKLTEIGLAQYNRGQFTIKQEVIAQPIGVLEKLVQENEMGFFVKINGGLVPVQYLPL